MKERLSAFKAQLMMKLAGFIFQKHAHPLLDSVARAAAWLNRKRYGNDALDFLDGEESIDIMNDSDYDSAEQATWQSQSKEK